MRPVLFSVTIRVERIIETKNMTPEFPIKITFQRILFLLNVLMSGGLLYLAITGGYGATLSFILFFMLAMQLTIHLMLVWYRETANEQEIALWKAAEAMRKEEQEEPQLDSRYAARVWKPGSEAVEQSDFQFEDAPVAYIGDDGELVYHEDKDV
jgi:hypothetical protein